MNILNSRTNFSSPMLVVGKAMALFQKQRVPYSQTVYFLFEIWPVTFLGNDFFNKL